MRRTYLLMAIETHRIEQARQLHLEERHDEEVFPSLCPAKPKRAERKRALELLSFSDEEAAYFGLWLGRFNPSLMCLACLIYSVLTVKNICLSQVRRLPTC